MTNGFIRVVYGIYDNGHRITARRQKIDNDINYIKSCPFNEPFKVYIFGDDNYKRLTDQGFDCVLVDKNPHPFDLIKHQYRNKMELIKYAMEHDFDHVVYMDWDCIPTRKLPNDFWEVNEKRGIVQACLQRYKHLKCPWRHNPSYDKDKNYHICRIVPNGGWLYIREKSFIIDAIQCWEENGTPDNDEIGYAKQVDKMTNGWMGEEAWGENYESLFCNLRKMSVYTPKQLKYKHECFVHLLR